MPGRVHFLLLLIPFAVWAETSAGQMIVAQKWLLQRSFQTRGEVLWQAGTWPDLKNLRPVMRNGKALRNPRSVQYDTGSKTFTFRVGLTDFGIEADFQRKRNRAEVMLDRKLADAKYTLGAVGRFCYEMYIPTAGEMQWRPKPFYQESIGFNPNGDWMIVSQWKQANRPGGEIVGAPPLNVNLQQTRSGNYELLVKSRKTRADDPKNIYRIPVPEAQWFGVCYGIQFHPKNGWLVVATKRKNTDWKVESPISPGFKSGIATTYPSRTGVNVFRFGIYRNGAHINDYVLKFRNVREDKIGTLMSRGDFIRKYLK